MIKKIFNRVLRTILRSSPMIDLRNKRRFAGVAIHTSANMDIRGQFICSSGNISVGSHLIVPEGAALRMGDDCYIGRYVELGPVGTIEIGNYTSIQDRCIILGDVRVGAYCVFAPNIFISSGKHHFDVEPWSLIKDQDEVAASMPERVSLERRQIVIGDDCWIGVNAIVMRGVRIGKGAVVGANSVVTQDVAPYAVVAGAPAKELRKRLDFVPPRAIRWDSAQDFPYFYSGFQLSHREREGSICLGGLVGGVMFSLALNAQPGDVLHIVVCSAGNDGRASLSFAGTSHSISQQFQEFSFVVRDQSIFHNFKYLSDTPQACLVVQSAWVT